MRYPRPDLCAEKIQGDDQGRKVEERGSTPSEGDDHHEPIAFQPTDAGKDDHEGGQGIVEREVRRRNGDERAA